MSGREAADFRLCERVGVVHPDFLPEDLTEEQIHDWEVFDRQWGSTEEWRLARLLCLLTNKDRKPGDAAKPSEFIPGYEPVPVETAAPDLAQTLMQQARARKNK